MERNNGSTSKLCTTCIVYDIQKKFNNEFVLFCRFYQLNAGGLETEGLKYLDHLAKMVDTLTGADGQLLSSSRVCMRV